MDVLAAVSAEPQAGLQQAGLLWALAPAPHWLSPASGLATPSWLPNRLPGSCVFSSSKNEVLEERSRIRVSGEALGGDPAVCFC